MPNSVPISDLNVLQLTQLFPDDFFPIVESASLTTYRLPLQTINNWFSISGSVLTASWSSQSISSSYSLTSSYSILSSLSLYAITASYSLWSLSGSHSLIANFAISSSLASQSLNAIFVSSASFATTSLYSISSSLTVFSISCSYASESVSSSYASQSISSSYALSGSWTISSSYAVSASYDQSASYAVSSSYAVTVSFAENSNNSQYAVTASYVLNASDAISSSFATNAATSAYALYGPTVIAKGPTFITPIQVIAIPSYTVPHGGPVWTTFDASSVVPVGTTVILLEGWAPNTNTNSVGFIYIRATGGLNSYILTAYESAGSGDAPTMGGQGSFPCSTSQQFDYQATQNSDGGIYINLIGYY